jgi:hypothetical protein
MAITHHFRGSKGFGSGYGHYAYIEDGQLVIGEEWPHEGGVTYQGSYAGAATRLATLKSEAPALFKSIEEYFAKHDPDIIEKVAEKATTEAQNNAAVWECSRVDPAYTCSNCRYVALHNARGRRVASKFCPHCGKYMTNHQEEA